MMNYIWELILKAMMQDIDRQSIHFHVLGKKTSPYMEMSLSSFIHEETLTEDLYSQVDINPYIRFAEIFFKWISPTDNGQFNIYPEFDGKLVDIIIHYLADTDLRAGMTRREFYIKFVEKDIENGVFGNSEDFKLFSPPEKRRISSEILNLYMTGNYEDCAERSLQEILPYVQIIGRADEEIIFYCRVKENEKIQKKVNFIKKLFMPVNINVEIHWEYTYGVIDEPNAIKNEQFLLG